MMEGVIGGAIPQKTKIIGLTSIGSDKALNVCPLVVFVLVVHPLYNATPDIPNSADTALISAKIYRSGLFYSVTTSRIACCRA